MQEYEFIQLFSFIFGAMIGSFLNVVIHRLPLNEDLVFKSSHCPGCKKSIKWYQNIPLLSFLALRGQCPNCQIKILPRYFMVELLTALMALKLAPLSFEPWALIQFFVFFSIFSIFICHFFIDVKYQILPDSLNLILALITASFGIYTLGLIPSFMGALLGFLFPLGITWLFYKLKGKVGLGGGDIKLYGALGFLLGPIGVMHTIFFSCFLGSILGVILISMKKLERDQPLAFGPFILLAASFQLFFQESYQSLLRLMFAY